eukprot:7978553-Pyramimonas_sp.AAC.1
MIPRLLRGRDRAARLAQPARHGAPGTASGSEQTAQIDALLRLRDGVAAHIVIWQRSCPSSVVTRAEQRARES